MEEKSLLGAKNYKGGPPANTPVSLEKYAALLEKRSREMEELFERKIEESPSALLAGLDRINAMIEAGVPIRWVPTIEKLVVGEQVAESVPAP